MRNDEDWREEQARHQMSQRLFVSKASHELRQPLAAMKLLISEIQRLDDPELVKELLSTLAQSAQMMEDFVVNIIDYHSLSADLRVEEAIVFSAKDVVIEVCGLLRDALTRANRSILFEGDDGHLKGDPALFNRMILALAENALHHGQGDIVLRSIAGPRSLTLEVRDQGPGVPEGEAVKIFDPYYQVEKLKRSEGGGLGLGLTIASLIAAKFDGQISVSSQDESGVCFSVALPITDVDHDAASVGPIDQAQDEAPNSWADPLEGAAIAVITGDDHLKAQLLEQLRDWNCVVSDPQRADLLIADTSTLADLPAALHQKPAVMLSVEATAQLPSAEMRKDRYPLQVPFRGGRLRALLSSILMDRPRS